jgi:hypothetical protein
MIVTYIQRDNQPPINTGKVGIDLTGYVADVKATASYDGRIASGATALAVIFVLDAGTANRLNTSNLGSGIRARVNRTGEWVLITAVAGQSATVTRAQLDSAGAPTVAVAVVSNDELFLVPLDAAVMTAILDPADTTFQTAIATFTSAQTAIPSGDYGLKIRFNDGANQVTWPTPSMEAAVLTIVTDANGA